MNTLFKFKGKRLDTGEFVYGSLVQSEISSHIIMGFLASNLKGIKELGSCEVEPDSVGIFTGFIDKFGTEIHSCDTLRYTDESMTITSPITYSGGSFWCDNDMMYQLELAEYWEVVC